MNEKSSGNEAMMKIGKVGILPTYKKAFTLAEMLITLGIIGIAASLTLPGLVQKQNDKFTAAKLKKAYNVMNNAYQLAIAEHGNIVNWGLSPTMHSASNGKETEVSAQARQRFLDILSPYLKVTSKCTVYRNNGKCVFWESRFLQGSLADPQGNTSFLKLADGTVITALYLGLTSLCAPMTNSSCGDFMVDINGKEPPNTVGIDIFNFRIGYNVIEPNGLSYQPNTSRSFKDYCNKNGTINYNGWGCTAWVIYNGNMDYLHCSDLSWEGKHSCKDKK